MSLALTEGAASVTEWAASSVMGVADTVSSSALPVMVCLRCRALSAKALVCYKRASRQLAHAHLRRLPEESVALHVGAPTSPAIPASVWVGCGVRHAAARVGRHAVTV
mmetsp:Transcript_29817/g.55054  ORF Transcript_29817/g.55054 Transcript_29817/m.55054 type:complete len:108 (-) Transcript_29817:105-428(-)